jgi:hypothetical protein
MSKQREYQVIVKVTKGKILMNRFARHYIKNYLDELCKHKAPQIEEQVNEIQLNGVDYDSSMEQGRATVHGYLRDLYIEENQDIPEKCKDHNNLASNIAKAVHLAGARYGGKIFDSEIGKKIVFSISPESTTAWKQYHIDPDLALRHIVVETFNRYSSAVMDHAKLGYAIGIHHDKEHYHAHVILMEFANTGQRLKLSNRQQVKQADGTIKRIDHLNCIIGTANSVFAEYQTRHIHGQINISKESTLVNQVEILVNYDIYTTTPHTSSCNLAERKPLISEKVETEKEIGNHIEGAFKHIKILSCQSRSKHGSKQTETAMNELYKQIKLVVARNNEIKEIVQDLRNKRRRNISESREQRKVISALKYRFFPKWLASSSREAKALNQLWYAHLALRGGNQSHENDGINPKNKDQQDGIEMETTQDNRVSRQQILELELDKAHLTELSIYLSAQKVKKQQEIEDQMRMLTREVKVCKIIQNRLELSLEIIEDAKNNKEPRILAEYEKIRKTVEDAMACEEILGNQTEFPETIPPEIATPTTQEQSREFSPGTTKEIQAKVPDREK